MKLELVPATEDRIPLLGDICHRAFSALHDRFGVERDIPDAEIGTMILSQTVKRPDYTGVMAVLDGHIVGSNFLTFADEVAGVGPITVEPGLQSKGVGRALMQWAVDEGKRSTEHLWHFCQRSGGSGIYATRLSMVWQAAG
jgi:GNAT superfamily N-acetyltransferase